MQFAYGEDGLDVTKKSFMKEFGFLARNAERFAQQVDLAGAKRSSDISGLSSLEVAAQKLNRCLLPESLALVTPKMCSFLFMPLPDVLHLPSCVCQVWAVSSVMSKRSSCSPAHC